MPPPPPARYTLAVPRTSTLAFLSCLCAIALSPSPVSAQEPARFALSMFHFNVQYVAGGLVGFPDGDTHQPGFELDEAAVEDLVVTESFTPLLELLGRHPTWTLTVELQGYMVEVMAARHPDVLEALRALVDDGRVELVSFHYSDQLFLAYPRVALERSHALLDAVLADAGLALSPVTFCQEGQFGEGMARIAPAHGQTILGLPKNLFAFQHQAASQDAAPLYRLEDTDVYLVGRGVDRKDLQVVWTFFDDGELWSTNDANPYLGPDFRLVPEAVAEYEQSLVDLEDAGFQIAGIADYVARVKELGIAQPVLPPVLDGTWQPGSTESMYRWMGRSGLWDALYQCERDNEVVTGNVRAIHELLAAEALVDWGRAEGHVGDDELEGALDPCWRDALLGEVTDASGINPWGGEVQYGLAHAAAARDCARAVSRQIATRAASPYLAVDVDQGTVTPLEHRPTDDAAPVEPRLDEEDGFTVDAPGRTVDVVWAAVGATGRLARVTITAHPAPTRERSLAVTFPFAGDALRISPGLVEDEVRTYPLDAFDLEDGTISLPVANGLFGLADDLWVIEDTTRVHVAATIRTGEPLVTFRDDTLDPDADVTWVFLVLDGDAADALAEAGRVNTRPTVIVAGLGGDDPDAGVDAGADAGPDAGSEPPSGGGIAGGACSCRAGASGGAASALAGAWLLALGLALRRRQAG